MVLAIYLLTIILFVGTFAYNNRNKTRTPTYWIVGLFISLGAALITGFLFTYFLFIIFT